MVRARSGSAGWRISAIAGQRVHRAAPRRLGVAFGPFVPGAVCQGPVVERGGLPAAARPPSAERPARSPDITQRSLQARIMGPEPDVPPDGPGRAIAPSAEYALVRSPLAASRLTVRRCSLVVDDRAVRRNGCARQNQGAFGAGYSVLTVPVRVRAGRAGAWASAGQLAFWATKSVTTRQYCAACSR